MPEVIAQNQNGAVTKPTQRIVRVEVETSQEDGGNKKVIHKTKIYDGLNVRFSILKRRGVMRNKCDIAICNLAKDQVEYLTTINAWENIPQNKQKVLRVWAGYRDYTGKENVGLLFEGDIIRAFPTTEPDVWLECNCLSGYLNQLKTGKLELKGKLPLKDICQKVAELLGLELIWKCNSTKTIRGFYSCGALTDMIAQVNELDDKAIIYQDGNCLCAEDYIPEEGQKADNLKEGQQIRVFNQTSGLISHPEPDPFGVKFRILLDPSIKCGDAVKLESDMIPSANGVYWVYSIKHHGELRGREFYSEINARKYTYGG